MNILVIIGCKTLREAKSIQERFAARGVWTLSPRRGSKRGPSGSKRYWWFVEISGKAAHAAFISGTFFDVFEQLAPTIRGSFSIWTTTHADKEIKDAA